MMIDGQQTEAKAFEPAAACGLTEMDTIKCPTCSEFSVCAERAKASGMNENLLTYMKIQNRLWKYDQEKRDRKARRAKAKRLAKKILKMQEEIAESQKELSEIFYNDERNRAFSHMERTCDPKNEEIRDALRLRMDRSGF
jgi:hypothetical protein